MARIEKDEEREDRIHMEIIVDAYGPEEQAMGWYYYLDDRLSCPFKAKCITERSTSPLRKKEEVEVTGMAPEDECMREMFVLIRWMRRSLAVPLSQLEPVDANKETNEAVGDWHYWVARGYRLG